MEDENLLPPRIDEEPGKGVCQNLMGGIIGFASIGLVFGMFATIDPLSSSGSLIGMIITGSSLAWIFSNRSSNPRRAPKVHSSIFTSHFISGVIAAVPGMGLVYVAALIVGNSNQLPEQIFQISSGQAFTAAALFHILAQTIAIRGFQALFAYILAYYSCSVTNPYRYIMYGLALLSGTYHTHFVLTSASVLNNELIGARLKEENPDIQIGPSEFQNPAIPLHNGIGFLISQLIFTLFNFVFCIHLLTAWGWRKFGSRATERIAGTGMIAGVLGIDLILGLAYSSAAGTNTPFIWYGLGSILTLGYAGWSFKMLGLYLEESDSGRISYATMVLGPSEDACRAKEARSKGLPPPKPRLSQASGFPREAENKKRLSQTTAMTRGASGSNANDKRMSQTTAMTRGGQVDEKRMTGVSGFTRGVAGSNEDVITNDDRMSQATGFTRASGSGTNKKKKRKSKSRSRSRSPEKKSNANKHH